MREKEKYIDTIPLFTLQRFENIIIIVHFHFFNTCRFFYIYIFSENQICRDRDRDIERILYMYTVYIW